MTATARRPDQRGFATVAVVALAGVVLLVGAVVVGVAAIMVAHRRAQSAADLAALAGAGAGQHGADACAAAATIAAANGGRLVACARSGDDVTVRVAVRAPPLPGLVPDLDGEARAGPVATSGL